MLGFMLGYYCMGSVGTVMLYFYFMGFPDSGMITWDDDYVHETDRSLRG